MNWILSLPHVLLVIQQMMSRRLNKRSSDIFIQEKEGSVSEDRSRDSQSFQGVTYLRRGDSSAYIEQFLGKQQLSQPAPPAPPPSLLAQHKQPSVVHEQVQESDHSDHDDRDSPSPANPSAFHNFQKHLTVALKHAVTLKEDDALGREHVRIAARLWKAFSQSKVCTKKVLHFLLGDRNQHQTSREDLRQFGFTKIFEGTAEKVMRQARRFLLTEVLRQVRDERVLDEYFEHKRIKDKDKFKKYVSIFVEELEEGFLRKRLSREKVAELMRA